ncbi:hypothetical protein D3C86_1635910 [compost metagenome]
MTTSIAETIIRGLGLARTWLAMFWPRFTSAAARETRMPVPVEMSRAGIAETRPSPMVNRVKSCSACMMSRCCWKTPIRMPPTMLTAVMMRPAIASPLVNLVAPSMVP